MNSIHLDYPIHRRLKKISAEEIPNVLPQVHPKEPGYHIQGTKAVLIPEAWLTYLFCTNHEDRSYDLLHHVIASGEDPEPVFRFVLEYLGTLGFRRIRSIADSIRCLLDTPSPINDRSKWDPFLEKLDTEADKLEHPYREISHIDWVIPGENYTLMLFCRDQKLRFLDVSPLMDQPPYLRIKDPNEFRKVTAFYGAVTWFPTDWDMEIDIDPDWCYENGVEVDLYDLAKAIRKENPVNSMDLSSLSIPTLSAGHCNWRSDAGGLDQEFLELWLPDPADEDFPLTPKRFYGNENDMKAYMDAVIDCPWTALHQKRIDTYRQYCDGDNHAEVKWSNTPEPLFTKRKVEFQQQVCLEDVHWCHVDRHNRLIPIRARKILLDQVILEENDEYIYCVRPTFEGLEQADYQQTRWVPVAKKMFSVSNVIQNQDGKIVSRLYMESNKYSTFCLALTAMDHPAHLNLRAVMDEFFGDFAF